MRWLDSVNTHKRWGKKVLKSDCHSVRPNGGGGGGGGGGAGGGGGVGGG